MDQLSCNRVLGLTRRWLVVILALALAACAGEQTPSPGVSITDIPPTPTADTEATAASTATATTAPTLTPTATVGGAQPTNTPTATATRTATPSDSPPGFELGGQIYTFLTVSQMQSARMTWVKMQVRWTRGGTTADARNIIDHGRRHGFKVLLSVKGDRAELAANPAQYYQEFAGFLAAVAALGPDAIEVWNEPNIDREWPAGLISGTNYAQMLARAYPAIKAANPNVMVISGAPAPTGFFGGQCTAQGCDDYLFITQMAAAGAASYFDCTGLHYNEGIIPPDQTSGDPRGNGEHYTRYYQGMVTTYRAVFPNKPLCFTELGYLTPEGYGPLPAGFEWAANTSLQEQAEWLARAAVLSRDSGIVLLMIVFNMDGTVYGADPVAGYAIIRGGQCRACVALAAALGG